VGSTSARLNAAVNPHGRPTTYRFEYGPTTSYGSATAPEAVSPVNSSHRQVGAQLSGPPGATYHYRVVAESAAGTATGADRTVTLAASADPYAATVAATPGLRSYWRLGETSGAFSWDEHGLELGTYRGGPSLGQPGALSRESNPATAFDGVDDELSATGPVISTSGTLEGWFRWSSGKAVLRDDSWAEGWVLAYENTSGNLGYRVGGRAFSTGRDVDTLARDGAWHHIAVTKDSSSAAIYLDGALQHPDTGATNDLASGPWHVMRNGQHSEYAQGQADEIAIYDVALPAATIKQHYDAAQPDRTPPETTIDSGTTGLTNGTSASFTFSSSEAGSTFRCRLDGPGPSIGSEASCSSPKSYTGLGNGSYTFRVHATDPSGNADASPATGSFTVDTAAPQTTIDSGPSGTTTATDASFSFSSSESGSSFQCRLGSGAWSPCSSPKGYGGLAPGSYTFEVAATDAAGNLDVTPASRSFTIAPASSPGDTSPPDTAITAGPDGLETQNDVSFSLSSTEPGSGYRCRLDGPGPALGDEASCGSPRSYSDLADGGYTFRVYAVDPAGNGDPTPATRSFTIDTTAPETTIDSGPSGTTTSPDATFSFSAAEPGSAFQCRLDMGAWAACTSPAAYTGLPAGAHVFEVRATDPAGNTDTTPASRTFTVQPPAAPAVDASPPDTTIDSGPSGAGTSTEASFSFSSSEPGSDFRCRLDGSDWGACSSPAGYSALGYGEHVFEVRATDSAGNADPSPASRTWSVERESAPAPGEPDQEGGPSPVRRSYRPRGYDIRSGRVYRGRGALRRLHRDESRRLELAGRRKRPGVYASDVVIRTSVRAAVRASLARLAVRYNGGATGGTITLSVYNHRTRRWRTIHGPSRARRSDRDVRWSTSKRPRDYVSRGGAILLRVRGTAQRAFRLRSDLVRFTIDY
jgi:hypothetical protein